MKRILVLILFAIVISACGSPAPASDGSAGTDYVGIFTLLFTVVGWGVTAYLQNRIILAQRDHQNLDFAQKIALSKREKKQEVLSNVWIKLQDTYGWLSHLTARAYQYPDLDSWPADQLNEWISQQEFTNVQKGLLLNSPEKNKFYRGLRFAYDSDKAQASLHEFHNYLINNKPFIVSELFEELGMSDGLFTEVLNGVVYARNAQDDSIESHYFYKLSFDGMELVYKIDRMIREELDRNFPLTT